MPRVTHLQAPVQHRRQPEAVYSRGLGFREADELGEAVNLLISRAARAVTCLVDSLTALLVIVLHLGGAMVDSDNSITLGDLIFLPVDLLYAVLGIIDICGPMPNSSPGGFQYFITHTDEYTKMVAVYMLRTRNESAAALRRLCGEWGKTPETIRSDWAQELSAGSFEQECIDRGIKRQFSAPYTPRENGVAEPMNRTLLEKGTAILLRHGITTAFWPFAIDTAAYLRNRMPTESLSEDKTPYEMWHGRRPYLGHVRVWGCLGYVHVRKPFRAHKFAARAVPMLLIGYDGRTKDAYRMWNPKTRRVIISRDVRFLEKRTWHRRLVPASWKATHRLGEPLQARPELVDDHAQRGDGLADLAHQSARRGDVIVNPESDPIVAEKPEIRDVEPDEVEEMGDLDQQGHVQAGGDESFDGPSGAGDVQMDGQSRASNSEHDHMM
ncbi:unnamed protein product [Vitrella brassicaformis CCMP3155]|uniref:Integrase catalytic domain-containing protein n=1 Tax=Vitrella brassicaformis (strain CCMP3155) TaxID=1169540 RepID=A0A0G4GKZ2_VITBC|nr:unnamed protein product [Vitrella brassicaformis CCMP3155]|eukprot:CEM30707.1 unnamed protein product [Vitrella brassicaformis CCMP3155]